MESLKLIPQDRQTLDFAESERQKSKNLCCFVGNIVEDRNGIVVTVNSIEQTITINGTALSSMDAVVKAKNILPVIKGMKGKKLTSSFKIVSGTGPGEDFSIHLCSMDNGSPYDDRFIIKGVDKSLNSTTTIEITSNNIYDSIMFYIRGNVTFSNLKFKIQIEENDVKTDFQHPHGPTVHGDELLSRELVFGEIFDGFMNITDCTFTTLKQYFDLFNLGRNSGYYANIGAAANSKFREVVGIPDSFGSTHNYINCYIKPYCIENENGRYGVFKLFAIDSYKDSVQNMLAEAYIFRNGNKNTYFSGWKIIGG